MGELLDAVWWKQFLFFCVDRFQSSDINGAPINSAPKKLPCSTNASAEQQNVDVSQDFCGARPPADDILITIHDNTACIL